MRYSIIIFSTEDILPDKETIKLYIAIIIKYNNSYKHTSICCGSWRTQIVYEAL